MMRAKNALNFSTCMREYMLVICTLRRSSLKLPIMCRAGCICLSVCHPSRWLSVTDTACPNSSKTFALYKSFTYCCDISIRLYCDYLVLKWLLCSSPEHTVHHCCLGKLSLLSLPVAHVISTCCLCSLFGSSK